MQCEYDFWHDWTLPMFHKWLTKKVREKMMKHFVKLSEECVESAEGGFFLPLPCYLSLSALSWTPRRFPRFPLRHPSCVHLISSSCGNGWTAICARLPADWRQKWSYPTSKEDGWPKRPKCQDKIAVCQKLIINSIKPFQCVNNQMR